MKGLIFLYCCFFFSNMPVAAVIPAHLIAHADSASITIKKDHRQLSAYLAQPAVTEVEKVLVFSYWIAGNIRYDMREANRINRSDKTASEVLQNRKGICEGFSNLFQQFCDNEGTTCYTITGYAYGPFLKRTFRRKKLLHAWNVVYVDNEWKLVDVTWAGTEIKTPDFRENRNLAWIFPDPASFAQTHLPWDRRWQMLADPLTSAEFWKQEPITTENYHWQDSLNILPTRSAIDNNLAQIRSHYQEEGNQRLYINRLLQLGWDCIGGSFDSLRISRGIGIFDFALAEVTTTKEFRDQKFIRFIRVSKRTARARLENRF